MRRFRVIGVSLMLLGLCWVALTLLVPLGAHNPQALVGFEHAFDGDLKLPKEAIEKHFDAANARMLAANETGVWWRNAGRTAAWASFAATSAITLIAGFYGRAPNGAGENEHTDGLPAGSVRIIAFLAALAAVLTAAAGLTASSSQEYFSSADRYHEVIVQSRSLVTTAKTSAEAQDILNDLDRATTR
ncbi:hypothetical protein [Rhizobium leguminosarum]